MSMIAFYVTIDSPTVDILPPHFYNVSLWVSPVAGLYAFCVAVTSSLFLSHIQVLYHRNAVAADRADMDVYTQRLSEAASTTDSDKPGFRGRGSSWLNAGTVDLQARSSS